jgi:hypothetical protein
MKKACLFPFLLFSVLVSCDFTTKPYLKHEIAFKKLGADCSQMNSEVNIEANTIGERYVFQECLAAGFNGEGDVVRRGDTVDVRFNPSSDKSSLYEITLDINTWPVYHFITINGKTVSVHVERD